MSGAGQVARGWDLDRMLRDYEQRINTLEKLARGAGTSAFLVDAPRWRSNLSGVLATTSGTVHWLAFDSAGSSPDHNPSGTSNSFFVYSASAGQHRYTAQVAGLYQVVCCVQWAASGVGTRKLHITRNNTGDAVPLHTSEIVPSGSGGVLQDVHGPVALAAGDWIRIAATQNSGGALNITNSADSTSAAGGRTAPFLSIYPVGAYAVA